MADVNLKYFNWFKNKEIKKNIINSNFNNVNDLKKFILKNYLNKKDNFFIKIQTLNKHHIGNIRIHNINLKNLQHFLAFLLGIKNFGIKVLHKSYTSNF